MTQGPDLRRHAALREEWIVGGHRAVVVEPHDLAEVGLHVLRRRELLAFAGTDPEFAVRTKCQPVSPVSAALDLRHLAPDHREILESAAALRVQSKTRACHRRATGVVFTWLRVTHVHQVSGREIGMQDDVSEAALAAVGHRRHAHDLALTPRAHVQQFERALLFGHQQSAIGQKRHGPGFAKLRHGCGAEFVANARRLRSIRIPATGACGGEQQAKGVEEDPVLHAAIALETDDESQ